MKEIRTFKAGEMIPTDAKFLFFFPSDQLYHYEVPLKKETIRPSEVKDTVAKIVFYLNQVTSSKYSANSKSTERLIVARLNEGRTFEDFKTVIDRKFLDWRDNPQFVKYLRPETLFGNKFDGYLGGASEDSDPFAELDKAIEGI